MKFVPSHGKIIKFQEKLLKFVKNEKMLEKSLYSGSVYSKITEFWNTHSFD